MTNNESLVLLKQVEGYLEGRDFYYGDFGNYFPSELDKSGGICAEVIDNKVFITLFNYSFGKYSTPEQVNSLEEAVEIIDRWITALRVLEE